MDKTQRNVGVRPARYALTLTIDPDQPTFEGTVAIAVTVDSPTSSMTVGARALQIHRAWISTEVGERPLRWERVDDESVDVFPDASLHPGTHEIGFTYTGGLDGDGGLLRSESGGHTAVAALFAPIDARRAFPCFDDVRWRTPFSVTVSVPERFRVLANGELERSTTADGWTTNEFHVTPPLATYLVAVTVGEFEIHSSPATPRIRLAAALGAPNAERTVEAAAHVMAWLEDFIGHPYPNDALHHVAIPGFPGGTESFACISYNDRTLLGSTPASPQSIRASTSLIAHETSHMWFGGWVSPDDWGSVWMSEAIATLLEHTATADLLPGADPWTELAAGRARTLMLDELPHARAVEAAPVGRNEIEGMLDTFTYTKGSSVVRMLMDHLGRDGFRAVLHQYLARERFTTATSSDFLAAIDVVANEPGVGAMFGRWIREPGHPRILVTREGDGDGVTLRLDPDWPVQRPTPVAVDLRGSGGGARLHVVVDQHGREVEVPAGASVVVNPSGSGFFRTGYRIGLPAIRMLTDSEQSAHLDDLWHEVTRGEASTDALFDWLSTGTGQPGEAFAGAALRVARTMRRLMVGNEWERAQTRLRTVVARPDLATRGWSPEALLLHTELLHDVELGAQAAELMVAADADDPGIGALARASTTTSASAEVWDAVARLPRTPATMQALALSRDPAQAALGLDRCIAPEVGADEIPFALEGVLAGSPHLAQTWSWVRRNWPEVRSRVSKYYLPRAIRGIVECGDARLAAEIDRWLAAGSSGVPDGAAAQLRDQLAAYRLAAATLESGS